MVDKNRIHFYNDLPAKEGPVIYWMQRDQRLRDNWALVYAQEQAIAIRKPLYVLFCLVPGYLDATEVQYRFMLSSLAGMPANLASLNIAWIAVKGHPHTVIPEIVKQTKAGLLVTDFNPLRITASWKTAITAQIGIAFHEVDAHNIIPARHISDKAEFSAFTLRRKISKVLPAFMTGIPAILPHPFKAPPVTLSMIMTADEYASVSLHPARGQDTSWISAGEDAASEAIREFADHGLYQYTLRNDPNQTGQSGLSPYLHFGQLSAQRLAIEVSNSPAPAESKAAFLEELIVRRELADNFCLYNPQYDSFDGFHSWARTTLNKHRDDARPYLYEARQFEEAETHDSLWNAAQKEMMVSGKMHGFMRMYWAKKILEWTPSPEEAMAIAIYLNDTYELDGRDPNGYSGIAWSIGGVHDRPWGERPVFGMIRYMNLKGCLRKFDVKKYIQTWAGLDCQFRIAALEKLS